MMDKMLVIIFDDQSQAFQGARALQELESEGKLRLYAQTVIARDAGGKAEIKQKSDTGPIGASVSVFTQSLMGRFGKPEGSAIDAGAFGRVLFDLARLGAGDEFLAEAENSLKPGKAAVIAEVWEEATLPLDTRMQALGGAVLRSAYSDEELDSRIKMDMAALKADLDKLKPESHAVELQDDQKRRRDLLKKARELIKEALSV